VLPVTETLQAGTTTGARPAMLTVDDDPAVSRAVARDLRRRYGEEFRIVRAESGAGALDALRELKLRGDQVAVLLADHRMPGMTGIEFLEAAMDVFPAARRVLLTAYADTDVAIDAVNVVDLDHYLLKPWQPPEEKFYPVIDAQLDAWRAVAPAPVAEVKLVGHRWSARSAQVREFLARNQVPYRWFASDSAEGERLLEAAGVGPEQVPVVVTTDGDVLVSPEDAELAERVGLQVAPTDDFYDLLVVGGGPAGLSAAVYGASEGLRTALVERVATGGQAGQSSRIENYLGFPDGLSGAQLTDRARRQAVRFGAEIVLAQEAVELEVAGSSKTVRFADGRVIGAHCVLLANGVEYRELGAPGCAELTGRGLYYGSALTQAAACEGQDVVVVGGANSAAQAALYLVRGARSVTMLVRGDSLAAGMSHYLVEQIEAHPRIDVRTGTQLVAAHGDDHLDEVVVRSTDGHEDTLKTSWVFVFIGARPRTDWLGGIVERDDFGFVLAGHDLLVDGRPPSGWALDRPPYHLETSTPGVFVAGDVRSQSAKRVASAVGEGAMAVMLVHRYLEQL
jgi:thioredoxin reductase (NADPH)